MNIMLEQYEQGKEDERKEIIKQLEERSVLDCVAAVFDQYKAGYDYAVGIIKRRGGPKKVEPIGAMSLDGEYLSTTLAKKINELIASVNELKRRHEPQQGRGEAGRAPHVE